MTRENHIEQIASMLLEHLPPDGVLLDVGGNFGKVSAEIKRHQPGVEIHLFEPVREFVVQAATRLAEYSDVFINAVGLSDAPGEMTVYTKPHNPGWSTLDVNYATPEKIRHEVMLMRLDDYSPLPRVDAIKIDVEYWEGKVLKGGRRTIDKHRPVILTELSRGSEDLWWERVGEMERLKEIGYRCDDYLKRSMKQTNILLIPEEKICVNTASGSCSDT